MSHSLDSPENGTSGPAKAGTYVAAKLRELDAVLKEAGAGLLKDPKDDEAVHDLRVAIRRMRTLLKVSRRLFGRWHTDVVRYELAEVMRATAALRDEEVLEKTLEGKGEGPEFERWRGRRKAREAKLRRTVVAHVERGDLDRARRMLEALIVFPVKPKHNVALARFARRATSRARRKVERGRDADVMAPAEMHDLRIAYKELRYSIELFADALPFDARTHLNSAIMFQKRLGDLHDADVAIAVIRSAKGLPTAVRRQALTSLAALRAKRATKYLRELDRAGAPPRTEDTRATRALGRDAPSAIRPTISTDRSPPGGGPTFTRS